MSTPSNKWVEEEIEPGFRVQYRMTKICDSTTTKYQTVDLVDLEPFGRTLIVDGLIQSAQCDEFVYHECLVHPALLAHANPKSIYLGGGGEGSTAREILRHRSVERLVMVDIDEVVVQFCKDHLPENTAAFADPRLELIIDDAKSVLEKSTCGFDVIMMDLDDPLEGGPCVQLYTKEFYEMVKTKLNPGGIFITQAGAAGVKLHTLVWSPVYCTLRAVFPAVTPYNQAVYSFLDEWGWHIASVDGALIVPLSPAEVDARIAARVEGEMKFLDGISYAGLFSLPKMHRKTLAEETCVMSSEAGNYAVMHSQGLCLKRKDAPSS